MLLLSEVNKREIQQRQTAKMISHAAANIQDKMENGLNVKEKEEIEKIEKSLEEAKAILKMNDKEVVQYSVLVQRKLLQIIDSITSFIFGLDLLTKAVIVAVNAICLGVTSVIFMLFKKLTVEADKRILLNNTKKIIKKLEKLEKKLPNEERKQIRKEIEKLNKLL